MPEISSKKTLRRGLVDAVNELNKLLFQTDDPHEEAQILQLRTIYFELLEEVIRQEINRRTKKFAKAIEQLAEARRKAVEAMDNITKINEAISDAADAAKTVGKIVNIGLDVLG